MTADKKKPTLLVALGGNALIQKGQTGTIEEQFKNLRIPIRQIAKLSKDYKIIITHGNGPQVGNLLLQQIYVVLRGRVCPHAHIHGWCEQNRPLNGK